ncbi:MAG: 50S ribosomal protein L18 [Patescibacteria group bacterium]|nr:50S ribosomal protein L18 [Patescibacteria group bacterium]
MNKVKVKNEKLARRHVKIRSIISGTKKRPRLSVFRSNRGMFVQLIDDSAGKTLISANVKELKGSKDKKIEVAFNLGKLLAEKAKEKKISQVVFDRGGYKYHGRVKAVAEGAREGGLIF